MAVVFLAAAVVVFLAAADFTAAFFGVLSSFSSAAFLVVADFLAVVNIIEQILLLSTIKFTFLLFYFTVDFNYYDNK